LKSRFARLWRRWSASTRAAAIQLVTATRSFSLYGSPAEDRADLVAFLKSLTGEMPTNAGVPEKK